MVFGNTADFLSAGHEPVLANTDVAYVWVCRFGFSEAQGKLKADPTKELLMKLLLHITQALLSAVKPHPQAYTTIVYPVRGQAVVVHDGLNIRRERPWYEVAESFQAAVSESAQDVWFSESSQAWEPFDSATPTDGLDSMALVSGGIAEVGHKQVNPANGLPMLDGCIDVLGNPMGMDMLSDSLSGFGCSFTDVDWGFDFG